ncbi:MAG: heme peroxidase [Nitrosomonas sp.]|nr:heme peroxidase [Nitrosomonas sp.]MBP7111880.1 heme peroxidase [Nitrosomonas sp.]
MKLPTFIETLALTIVNKISEISPFLRRLINKFATNRAVNVCRHRPHPWSTVHDYVSWTSLTNKQWSARHLPAKVLNLPKDETAILALFQRESGKTRLCPKSTCLFPTFAQYLTDGFIRTRMPTSNHEDDAVRKQNTSNHEIDLSPLYGRTQTQTMALRCLSEEQGMKGKLKFQKIQGEEYAPFLYKEFSNEYGIKDEFKVLDVPLGINNILNEKEKISRIFAFGGDRANASPQIALMNTLFLREHNRLASKIEETHPDWNDERVFETARNTNIVLFIKIVIEEYINHISPIFKFHVDPSIAWNASWNKPNWITTEFSLLYRWHMLIPDVMRWGKKEYSVENTILNNVPLLDTGLKQSFIDMSAQIAGQIGALNTAQALVMLEENAIKQGRICNLASYNDYRAYVDLPKLVFKDISKNLNVTNLLEKAYHEADDIEFYVGLFSEDVAPNSPLPSLLRTMVAVDAFSQALTNPLLSEHVWPQGQEVFSKAGWEAINQTNSLCDVVNRNCAAQLSGNEFIGMTRQDWRPEWF